MSQQIGPRKISLKPIGLRFEVIYVRKPQDLYLVITLRVTFRNLKFLFLLLGPSETLSKDISKLFDHFFYLFKSFGSGCWDKVQPLQRFPGRCRTYLKNLAQCTATHRCEASIATVADILQHDVPHNVSDLYFSTRWQLEYFLPKL